jgi:hypothetical protein
VRPRLLNSYPALARPATAEKRFSMPMSNRGKKPLYCRQSGTSLAFASELKAQMADPAVSREVNPAALHHFLTYQYVPAPWSIAAEYTSGPGPPAGLAGRGGEPATGGRWAASGRR